MENNYAIIEPQSAPRNPIWGPWSTVGLGLATLVIYAFAQSVVAAVILVIQFVADPSLITFNMTEIPSAGLIISLSTFASTLAGCGLIALSIKARRGASIGDYLSLQPITAKTILILLAIALGFIAAESVISHYADISTQEMLINAYQTSIWPPLFWMATVLFAPLFEEAFFRGFLFAGLQRSKIGIIGTILVTSLVWTSLHVVQYGPYELAIVFLMGILLGLARYRTGSLWSPLLMHAFWNLLATLSLALTASGVIS